MIRAGLGIKTARRTNLKVNVFRQAALVDKKRILNMLCKLTDNGSLGLNNPPCPDIDRAYHEAGHAAMNLILGYGLDHCSIVQLDDGVGGVTKRTVEMVSVGHYPRLVAAGVWAEGLAGYDFEAKPCEDGGQGDRANLEQVLLDALVVPSSERDARMVSEVRRAEITGMVNLGYRKVFEAVAETMSEAPRVALVHEIAALLMEHQSLPVHILENLNMRLPVNTN